MDVVNYSDNKGDNIKMIMNFFFYQVTLKIWGFLLMIDAMPYDYKRLFKMRVFSLFRYHMIAQPV